MQDQYYLTNERLAELKAELEHLRTDRRVEVATRLREAKEEGDLSENSAYIQARDEQNEVEHRIFELDEILKRAVLIKKPAATETVTVGASVTAKKGDATVQYTIVGSDEARPEEGKISNESPLGSALLGKQVGDAVTIPTQSGTDVTYTVMKIE